jgi:hypothetical protein
MPALIGWNPSTSLTGSSASTTRVMSICRGAGCWTRIPLMLSSAFKRSTRVRSSSVVVPAGRRWSSDPIPTCLAFLCFSSTYWAEAGSSPTTTVASFGREPPEETRSATARETSSKICLATVLPSSTRAVTRQLSRLVFDSVGYGGPSRDSTPSAQPLKRVASPHADPRRTPARSAGNPRTPVRHRWAFRQAP